MRRQLPVIDSDVDWRAVQRHFLLAMAPWLVIHPILLGAGEGRDRR